MKPQLFLIHFAGGSCYSFQFIKPGLPEFDFIPLELPGRGRRTGEALLRNFEEAAADIYRQVERKRTRAPFFIYGHSLGARLALRIAGMLEEKGHFPAALIVSGNAGPGLRDSSDAKPRHLMKHEEFKAELRSIGGVPEELLENDELFTFYEPILRSDFQISASNADPADRPVSCPLLAIMGSEEEQVGDIGNWRHYTSSDFTYEIWEGNHFFIHKYPEKLGTIIKGCCSIAL
jgi:external thioesterase TEII